ncbi:DNA dC-_dU-editing enzyme APOBEC-3F-like isoform X2 [Sapajus apella]|uniref:single-stranded DNA cytosine deaminase n=1 Tax=Sapajus apella TaxID=9515 RepID=A0A6J3HFS6_SAPAP|nr:DNA dC->dU-editing enzyme APOBEC-3F-like isoform X2 [Sapajus apella]
MSFGADTQTKQGGWRKGASMNKIPWAPVRAPPSPAPSQCSSCSSSQSFPCSPLLLPQVSFNREPHAEMYFLSWFRGKLLPACKRFQITWFVSWNPCLYCVAKVAEFLAEHPNVTLTVSTARLYCFLKKDWRRALRKLCQTGARVKIMDYEELKYCWENFVYKEHKPFRCRDNFKDNYTFLRCKLQEILRNLRKAYGRNETWLCFTVEGIMNRSTVSWKSGIFRNQVGPDPSCHAEMCFLSWFRHNMLSPKKDYEVTWYASWSPCPECAGQVAEFLARHRNVRLTIFTARLYYFWNPDFRQGIRRLSQEGASVLIMGYEYFEYCWDNFVYNDGQPFKPWKRLQDNSLSLYITLQEILQ